MSTLSALRRHHQNRDVAALSDDATHVEPVTTRDAQVEKDQIRPIGQRARDRRVAVARLDHDVAVVLEQHPQHRADVAIVLDDQHARRHAVILAQIARRGLSGSQECRGTATLSARVRRRGRAMSPARPNLRVMGPNGERSRATGLPVGRRRPAVGNDDVAGDAELASQRRRPARVELHSPGCAENRTRRSPRHGRSRACALGGRAELVVLALGASAGNARRHPEPQQRDVDGRERALGGLRRVRGDQGQDPIRRQDAAERLDHRRHRRGVPRGPFRPSRARRAQRRAVVDGGAVRARSIPGCGRAVAGPGARGASPLANAASEATATSRCATRTSRRIRRRCCGSCVTSARSSTPPPCSSTTRIPTRYCGRSTIPICIRGSANPRPPTSVTGGRVSAGVSSRVRRRGRRRARSLRLRTLEPDAAPRRARRGARPPDGGESGPEGSERGARRAAGTRQDHAPRRRALDLSRIRSRTRRRRRSGRRADGRRGCRGTARSRSRRSRRRRRP